MSGVIQRDGRRQDVAAGSTDLLARFYPLPSNAERGAAARRVSGDVPTVSVIRGRGSFAARAVCWAELHSFMYV